MTSKKPLAKNAAANVIQAFVGALLLFALYRYINITLGVEQLGIWSVVLATVSASRLSDLGLSAGVTRFVARDRARGDLDRAGLVIDTATLTLMVSIGAVLPVIYLLLERLLPYLFSDQIHLEYAQEILVYALISLWLTVIAAVFQGGLDGVQRMDLRAAVVISGQVLLLGLAFLLVPEYGLAGLAMSQIGQGLFLVFSGRLLLCRALPTMPKIPRRFRKRVLKEMLGYGLNIQAATVFMLLLDPITKALMARFGGPASAGYFEMASQVVVKARAVLVTANQAIVPYVAEIAESGSTQFTRLYRESIRILTFVTLPAFSLLIAWGGGFSWLLTGTYQPQFVLFLVLLAIAWAANIIAGPAYFTNMGTGRVVWNTIAHIVMGGVNLIFGVVLGSLYGENGVLIAYVVAILSGSWALILIFQRKYYLSWRSLFSHEHVWLAFASLAVIAFACFQPLRPSEYPPVELVVRLLAPLLVLGIAVWFHPLRRRLWNWANGRQSMF